MLRRLVPPLVILALVLLPSAALAKGVEGATISGPGIPTEEDAKGSGGKPISGDPNLFAEELGGFAGVFGDYLFREPPQGDLGPKYTVTYAFISESGGNRRITQDVYPFAPNGTVTRIPPGQRLPFGEGTTPGGWFLAGEIGFDRLVAEGVPARNPELGAATQSGREPASESGYNPWLSGALIAVAATALSAALFRRSRPRSPRPA